MRSYIAVAGQVQCSVPFVGGHSLASAFTHVLGKRVREYTSTTVVSFCVQISSRLFFAHVRAASSTLGVSHCAGCDGGLPPWAVANGSVSTELCCHPFRCGRFLFMHNGSVGGFNRIRR